jgi:hypothetical protein
MAQSIKFASLRGPLQLKSANLSRKEAGVVALAEVLSKTHSSEEAPKVRTTALTHTSSGLLLSNTRANGHLRRLRRRRAAARRWWRGCWRTAWWGC